MLNDRNNNSDIVTNNKYSSWVFILEKWKIQYEILNFISYVEFMPRSDIKWTKLKWLDSI